MLSTTETKVSKDLANKKITVTKQFNAPPQTVWEAWTTKEVLDQWWAPKPWRAETKSMHFKEGGSWLYAMVAPEGERHNALPPALGAVAVNVVNHPERRQAGALQMVAGLHRRFARAMDAARAANEDPASCDAAAHRKTRCPGC